jgi:hypothetical protein
MRPLRALTRYVSCYERGLFALSITGPYVLIVTAATVYVEIATRQPGSQGLEAIVLFAVTSPTSQLLMYLPLDAAADHPLVFQLMFPAAGLVQAWLLWLIARGRKKAPSPSGVSAPG